MVNSTESALCAKYEAWKATRRFVVGDHCPRTPWAKRRAEAAQLERSKKRAELARSTRKFVIKA